MHVEGGLEILGVFGDKTSDRLPGPIACALDLVIRALFREFPAVGAFGLEIETGPAGDVGGFGPGAHPDGVTEVFAERVMVTIMYAPPDEGIFVRGFRGSIGDAAGGMSAVSHVVIDGLGIVGGILTPDGPTAVGGQGSFGRDDINLKIVAPDFARAIKRRAQIDEAGFFGD